MFYLNSFEFQFELKYSFYVILNFGIKLIIYMYVLIYKIFVNDDLKIEFKIVFFIYMYVLVIYLVFFF